MGSGVSSQVNDGGANLRQMEAAERKLAKKFPRFRDIKFKKTVYGSQDSGIATGRDLSYLGDAKQESTRGGIYTTVYSYYHWKNYKNKYNTLTPVNKWNNLVEVIMLQICAWGGK